MEERLTEPCRLLTARYGNGECDFQLLMDYGDSRYHLALLFNGDARPHVVENFALQKLYNAKEDDEVECVADECLRILWPFMKADYQARSKGSATAIPPSSNGLIKLKAWTAGGVVQYHNNYLI